MKRSAQFGAPVLFQKALATALQSTPDGQYPNAQYWQDALVSARLSPESQDSIVSAQQTLCAQMNTIVTNRKSLLAILQVCCAPAYVALMCLGFSSAWSGHGHVASAQCKLRK